MNYFVYVFKCVTGEYYKGTSNSISRRLKDHESGKVDFTKNKLPLKLIHVELCSTRKEARKLEKFLKSGYGREIIKEIAEENIK